MIVLIALVNSLAPSVASGTATHVRARRPGHTTTTTTAPTTTTTTASGVGDPTTTTTTSVVGDPTTTTVPATTTTDPTTTTTTSAPQGDSPPSAAGYFALQPVGSWSTLPSDAQCAAAVHRSAWEPRAEPSQTAANNTLVNASAVHESFQSRPRSTLGTYNPLWDSYLLPRVDGQFSGTTDEILQWAACKWGLPDNLIRADAFVESTWFQAMTYPDQQCVTDYGCGDYFSSSSAASTTYCNDVAVLSGVNYQQWDGAGFCPQTFSILGVMSWWNPTWGFSWAGNQNGTFPFNHESTAFAADYWGAMIRGCYEGWQWELGASYTAGDLWGCIGAWYDGNWHDSAANTYISKVQAALTTEPWLAGNFAAIKPECDVTFGCPS